MEKRSLGWRHDLTIDGAWSVSLQSGVEYQGQVTTIPVRLLKDNETPDRS